MKKIITFAALTLGIAMADVAYAANNEYNSSESNAFDVFNLEYGDLDSTTAFLNVDINNPAAEEAEGTFDVDELIGYAKKYLGRPYKYGAKGPNAFDCSGFTSYVFRKFDISLSPASKAQATQGTHVDRKDIRPGDLLIFKGRSGKAVGHVALAIDVDASGDVTFIHAATNSVRIDRLSQSAYYQQRYVGARRVINL